MHLTKHMPNQNIEIHLLSANAGKNKILRKPLSASKFKQNSHPPKMSTKWRTCVEKVC